jgi:carbon monoxide dehydrogenase subunit G
MKKFLFTIALVAIAFTANSQNNNGQTAKGKYLIELKTQIGNIGGSMTNTGFSFVNSNGYSSWSAGLDGGCFIADNFALKAGFGYADSNHGGSSVFTYKVDVKYYLKGKIPFEVDLAG